MNKSFYEGLYDKNDGYVDKIKDGRLKIGENSTRIKKVIQINFYNFEIFDERIVIKFRMMDTERHLIRSNYVYNKDVEIYHVNLKRVREMYYNKDSLSKFEKELLMMTIDNEKELTNISKEYREMEKVADKISKVSREEELQGIYDIEEREVFIRQRIRQYAEERGYDEGLKAGIADGTKKGLEQGLEQGIKQGIEQGIAKGTIEGALTKQKEIAKKLLEVGIDIDIIEKSTGIKLEENKD